MLLQAAQLAMLLEMLLAIASAMWVIPGSRVPSSRLFFPAAASDGSAWAELALLESISFLLPLEAAVPASLEEAAATAAAAASSEADFFFGRGGGTSISAEAAAAAAAAQGALGLWTRALSVVRTAAETEADEQGIYQGVARLQGGPSRRTSLCDAFLDLPEELLGVAANLDCGLCADVLWIVGESSSSVLSVEEEGRNKGLRV